MIEAVQRCPIACFSLLARFIVPLRHLPGRDAIVRLADAVLADQNDEWTVFPTMRLEILAACRKAAHPRAGQNNLSEAGLTVEAIPA